MVVCCFPQETEPIWYWSDKRGGKEAALAYDEMDAVRLLGSTTIRFNIVGGTVHDSKSVQTKR